MKTLLTTLAVALSATSFSYGVPDLEIANRIGYAYPGTATIDGQISDGEWDSAFKYASQPIDRTLYENDRLTPPASPEDLSGEYWAIWDEEGLYLLIKLIDDGFPPTYPPESEDGYAQHSFVVYTSPAYSRFFGTGLAPGYDGIRDMEAQFGFSNEAVIGTHGIFSYGAKEAIDASVTTEYVLIDGGCIVELMLPWRVVLGLNEGPELSFSNGMFSGGHSAEKYGNDRDFIGFDVHIQDYNEEGRKSRVGWCDGYEGYRGFRHWMDTQVWGTLVLANPPPCTVLETVIAEPHWTLFEGDFAYGNNYGHFIYTGFCPFVYDFGSNDWWYVFEGNENPDAFYFYSYKDAAWAVFYNGVCYF